MTTTRRNRNQVRPHRPPLPTRNQVQANWYLSSDNIANLLHAIRPGAFTGARCTGKAPLFDSQREDETPETFLDRLATAQELCRSCPAQTPCRDAILTEPPSRRTGIRAGVDYAPTRTNIAHEKKTA